MTPRPDPNDAASKDQKVLEDLRRFDPHDTLNILGDDIEPDTRPPLDLDTVPRDQLAKYEFSTILPPAPVLRYLDTDDPLTHHIINKIELAMEEHYKLPDPWYITAERSGKEGKDLRIDRLILLKDLDKEKETKKGG